MLKRSKLPLRDVLAAALVVWLAALPADGQQAQRRDTDTTHMIRQVRPDSEEHATAVSGRDAALSEADEQMVERTNAFREENGLAAVKTNEELAATARYFADYMARTGKYGHTADGKESDERAANHDYDFCLVSENIAYYYSDGEQVAAAELAETFVTGWIESEGHRENMLTPEVLETGIAVARDTEDNYYFAVQMFGRPRSAAITFQVVNKTAEPLAYTVEVGDDRQEIELAARAYMEHTRCLPPTLVFEPDLETDEQQGKPVRREMADGDKLIVTREQGNLQLRLEEVAAAASERAASPKIPGDTK